MTNKRKANKKKRQQTKLKKTGFKRRMVVFLRKKGKKGFENSCSKNDPDFIPEHITRRHTGRSLRKAARLAQAQQPAKAKAKKAK